MLAKRIIPCLDVRDGRVVKGVNFVNIRDVGDPVDIAAAYESQGADEIVFLDITATHEGRGAMLDVVRRSAERVFMPMTVGGGVRTVGDVRELLRAGADKVSINSAAVRNPALIREAAQIFGSQCVVCAIDAGPGKGGRPAVYIGGGRIDTGLDVVEWARRAESLGAGEILLTSMRTDGVKTGYDLSITSQVCDAVCIPVIASGGAGSPGDFYDVFSQTGADAALAATLFHDRELTIPQLKQYLFSRGVAVRREGF
ncbi:imidazole glycerol phosphate synthase subunit HisF [Feifania hominis]|uniref:Imidazole glycerol phosphate synthase subunit HisF n=1 Tax=Feifania hominis TaxID=2763660 RepID=A0A926HQD1_9FIRM|nr:imidazole glycerol phosphate synthase subunit HisF [Feifania hominis]MBC8536207.1 imidazole glycerol phosphate synthase subunit HisF [Feifania hominis]